MRIERDPTGRAATRLPASTPATLLLCPSSPLRPVSTLLIALNGGVVGYVPQTELSCRYLIGSPSLASGLPFGPVGWWLVAHSVCVV